MEADQCGEDSIILNQDELQILSELDSRQFGFVKLSDPLNVKKRALCLKAVRYLESLIIQANNNNKNANNNNNSICDEFGNSNGMSDKDSGSPGSLVIKEEGGGLGSITSMTTLDDLDKLDASITTTDIEQSNVISIDPKTYCKLGHLHLLLEDYPKAMSAYQKFYNLRPKDYWRDATFLYGQGLVYFHFNAFQWAIKAFQEVLYIDPGFSRANEVHLRLGLMFKVQSDYESSLKHFQLALIDAGPASFTKNEIRFHEAHLYELQNKQRAARDAYECLLREQELPNQLRADILRQLGWMYHTVEALGDKNHRETTAVQYLQKSIEADPKSGQSLYLLGRCFSSLGKVHDAFIAYRNSVDKCEGNADTWCSIGVLYQQQNQHIDALQAYICAVQYDKGHTAAWTNLGILYETCNQPRDALACYMNATRNCSSTKPANPNLAPRIRHLQQQLANAPMPSVTNKPRQLLSIEEAWNLPVTTDMSSRQQGGQGGQQNTQQPPQQRQPQQVAPGFKVPPGYPQGAQPPPYPQGNDAKRFKPDIDQQGAVVRPPYYLTQQQMATLQYYQQNSANLTPQQQQQYQQLQHNFRLMQQHQHQLRQQQLQQQQQGGQFPGGVRTATPGTQFVGPQTMQRPGFVQQRPNTPNANFQGQGQTQGPGGQVSYTNTTQSFPTTSANYTYNNNYNNITDHLPKELSDTVSDQELQELISHREFATSLAEDLLNRLAQGEDVITGDPSNGDVGGSGSVASHLPNTQFSNSTTSSTSPTSTSPTTVTSSPNIRAMLSGVPATGTFIKQEAAEKNHLEAKLTADSLTNNITFEALNREIKVETAEPVFSINMCASEIQSGCAGRGPSVRNASMMSDRPLPPSPPEPPAVRLTKEQLLPPTPSVLLDNKKLAFSMQLQEFCLQHPIAVVRGLAHALKLDLGLFSTKTLVEAQPEHSVEVRTQLKQDADENIDPQTDQKVWPCVSTRSHTTVAKYAQYQAASFQESLKEEQDRIAAGIAKTDEAAKKKRNLGKVIKFGTNVDLSDERKWRNQLTELMKLPVFARVVSAGNMISHVGHQILGMNTVQLYMKVPGSRTPGHQENNNFCSININIGPGDCEWFAVPEAYWGVIHRLCEKNGTKYLHGSWWPDLDELYKENVPVYRFHQKPGDMVWVNSGCVHWVQAVGWCNNIAWNVGPLTARQYQLSMERYEWNKMQSYKSIVPVVHLSWNLARNIKVSDTKLYELLKGCLMRSLRQVCLSLDFVKICGMEIKFHGHKPTEASHYCGVCELEVFDVLFVREQERRHVVHCVDCARRQAPRLEGFVVLEEFHLHDLTHIYDSFILHSANTMVGQQAQTPPPPTSTTPTPFST